MTEARAARMSVSLPSDSEARTGQAHAWPVRVVLFGAPTTKKNSSRIVGTGARGRTRMQHPVLLPSKQHQKWFGQVIAQARVQRPSSGVIAVPINVRALIYRHRAAGDAVGFYQAIADLLEAAHIVKDDVLCVSWDGSRLLKDTKFPRIEIELTVA